MVNTYKKKNWLANEAITAIPYRPCIIINNAWIARLTAYFRMVDIPIPVASSTRRYICGFLSIIASL
jgi:hypothetical protein